MVKLSKLSGKHQEKTGNNGIRLVDCVVERLQHSNG